MVGVGYNRSGFFSGEFFYLFSLHQRIQNKSPRPTKLHLPANSSPQTMEIAHEKQLMTLVQFGPIKSSPKSHQFSLWNPWVRDSKNGQTRAHNIHLTSTACVVGGSLMEKHHVCWIDNLYQTHILIPPTNPPPKKKSITIKCYFFRPLFFVLYSILKYPKILSCF